MQQTFSIKDVLLKILDIVGHMLSDTADQLCCYILKIDLDKERMCLCSNKIKLYLQKKPKSDGLRNLGHGLSLPTSDLYHEAQNSNGYVSDTVMSLVQQRSGCPGHYFA